MRRCNRAILGEDELFLIMQYYVENMIDFTLNRSVRSHNENIIRNHVFRTLFGLSCSKSAFKYSKHLFAKYLWHTQSYMNVYTDAFNIAHISHFTFWSQFKWKNKYRLSVQCAWNQTISILCFVTLDTVGTYRLRFLSEDDAKKGNILFTKHTKCVPIISMSHRKADVEFINGFSYFQFQRQS